jgi:hypothetical protein
MYAVYCILCALDCTTLADKRGLEFGTFLAEYRPKRHRLSSGHFAPKGRFRNEGLPQRGKAGLNSFGSSSKNTEIVSESFGLVVARLVVTVPNILGVVWPDCRPKSDSKSKIPAGSSKVCGILLAVLSILGGSAPQAPP